MIAYRGTVGYCLVQRQNYRFFFQLWDLIQHPFGYWPNDLTTSLPPAPKAPGNAPLAVSASDRPWALLKRIKSLALGPPPKS